MADPDNVIYKAMLWGVKMGMAQAGDPVVVTSGVLEEQTGSTNIMRVLRCVGFAIGPVSFTVVRSFETL